MAKDNRYWDADVFLGYFNQEAGKVEKCEGVLKAAANKQILIVTSALTLAEVLWMKGQPKMDPAKRKRIERFFKQPYIHVINVTRRIAEDARDLVWDHKVKPKDAIHVATALVSGVSVLNTFDQGLLDLDEIVGAPPLRIEIPHEPFQQPMKLYP